MSANGYALHGVGPQLSSPFHTNHGLTGQTNSQKDKYEIIYFSLFVHSSHNSSFQRYGGMTDTEHSQ